MNRIMNTLTLILTENISRQKWWAEQDHGSLAVNQMSTTALERREIVMVQVMNPLTAIMEMINIWNENFDALRKQTDFYGLNHLSTRQTNQNIMKQEHLKAQ
jgi:hypothetical protein